MKKKIIILIFTVLILVILIAGIIVFNSNKGEKDIQSNTIPEPEYTTNDIASSEFILYPDADEMLDLTIGTYLYGEGRKELCKMKVPSNYQIQNGLMRNVEEKENIDGIIGSLQEQDKLYSDKKILSNFYLGNANSNYIEPSENDTIMRVSVYTDSWKEVETIENAYQMQIGNLNIYALRNDTRNPNAVSLYLPFDEYLMVCINYQSGPQIDSTSLETIANAIAENITI